MEQIPKELHEKILELDVQIGIISRQIRWNKAYLPGLLLLAVGLGVFIGWLVWA